MSSTISNTDDLIDSRDVIARIAELESIMPDPETKARVEELEAKDELTAEEDDELAGLLTDLGGSADEDELAELKALQDLQEEAEGYAPDWKFGATLIHESHFENYARDLAEDLGYISRDDHWPHTCIDWEQAARELQQDYTSVDFDGETYWVR